MANNSVLPHGPGERRVPMHPWYKERLRTKYLRDSRSKQHLSGALNALRWRFLQPGLDDFRNGYPSTTSLWSTKQAQIEIQPSLFQADTPHTTHDLTHNVAPKTQKWFTKEQVYLSKQNPLRQARREHVACVEQSLLQRPLAHCQHMKDSMPPELFSQVALVLDPAMHADNGELLTAKLSSSDFLHQSGMQTREVSPVTSAHCKVDGPEPRNPYMWKPERIKGLLGCQGRLMQPANSLHITPLDEDVHRVTRQFSNWMVSLVGEDGSMNESTLLDLFVKDEGKPSLAPSSCKVERSDLSEKLSGSLEDWQGTMAPDAQSQQDASKAWRKPSIDEPYGDIASAASEDIQPDQANIKDEELMELHGTQAFRQFILSKGLREPRFLHALFSNKEQERSRTGRSRNISASSQRGHTGL